MSRGGALMGKRALVTHVTESSHTDREGFVVDPFWGASTPAGIAALPKLVEKAGQDELRKALVFAVEHLGGAEVSPEELEGVDHALAVGVVELVAAAVKARADEETILADMAGLGIAGGAAKDVAMAVSRGRGRMMDHGDEAGRGFPRLEETRWRVDVTISNTALSRVLKPTVLMQLTLSDGSVRRVEVDAEKLQQLRFHAASALSSMQAMR
eukprot:CAMPEP_0169464744 /NCGR_PEP_ID=MMETSP1042-20121227/20839_1 /TAXON_ID=464988 /ORGANISM="Hemiselmis andersenii, Strain CCMP1180" /LENGTH=211 /DNA_ID=CAMNT_0009577633 /DNA_START=167 /DNA_END=798 /DNA_ORIENTATION=-